jgi:hypothetical protein
MVDEAEQKIKSFRGYNLMQEIPEFISRTCDVSQPESTPFCSRFISIFVIKNIDCTCYLHSKGPEPYRQISTISDRSSMVTVYQAVGPIYHHA